MNKSYILSLVDDNVKQVRVKFLGCAEGKCIITSHGYDYISTIPNIQKGDLVLVEARDNFSVAKVVSVMDVPDDNRADLKFVICKTDAIKVWVELNKLRDRVSTAFNSIARERQKAQLREAIKKELGEDVFDKLLTAPVEVEVETDEDDNDEIPF